MKLLSFIKRFLNPPIYVAFDDKPASFHKQHFKPYKNSRQHQPQPVFQLACNTFAFALSLIGKISDCAPVPGLKGAIATFNFAMQTLEGTQQDDDDLDDLAFSIDSFNDILSKFEDPSLTGRVLTDDLGEQLFVLSRQLASIKERIQIIQRHSKVRRIFEAKYDAQTIVAGFRQLQAIVNEIMVGSALKAEARLADLWALDHLDKLPRAKDARFDYVNRPRCSPSTRESVLKQIMQWVKKEDGHQIYWLSGGAGTGKTTIALTVAEILSKDTSIFSASFFCSRESESRSDAKLIFPTFAYLFARCDVEVRNVVVGVIRDSPDIGHSLPGEQLSKLLFGPLREVYTGSQRPVVLVIDALDECAGGRAPETILRALAREIRSVPFVKVFVSSRPTASTNDAFAHEALRLQREVFVLHNVDKDIVDADIYDYMMERLSNKARLRGLSISPWPPPELIKQLVKMAGGLFIFASTVCEFIEARGDLDFRLREMVNRPFNEYTGIDGLYRELLEFAIAEFPDQKTVDQCRTIIGTIILLQDPLSCHDLGQLLRLPPKHIQGILGDLQAVLSIPESHDGSIRVLHASFPDFISTKTRCLPIMYVEPGPQHYMISLRLLEIMQTGLKRNMAYFIRFKLNKEEHFPRSLQYACRFWADHLYRADVREVDELIIALNHFATTNFVHCLEVLDSIGKPLENLSEIVIQKAEAWLSGMRKLSPTLRPSLKHVRSVRRSDTSKQDLLSLFGLSPDTRYAQRGCGRLCSEGTRNDVLENALAWINDPCASQLYWLNGAAGTGKTTIIMTINDLAANDRGILTAAFFCSRYSKFRRQVRHLFVTLSILLATREVRFRDQLVKAVRRNPHVIHYHPRDQFHILIVEPIRRAGLMGKPILFVIDALDECRPLEENALGRVISALKEHLHAVPALKVLITTRSSITLSKELSANDWKSPPTYFNLDDIHKATIDADIRRYLFEILCTNATMVERLSPTWPPDDLVDMLVAKAGGLFIYASFLGQRFILVGPQKLKEIAEDPGSEYEGNLGLNIFYGRMLKWLIADNNKRAEQFRAILGVLTHLHQAISVEDFTQLIDVEPKDIQLRLLELQPIVIVSRDKLMRPIHLSVKHWLIDPDRSLPSLLVKSEEVHQSILFRLVGHMSSWLGPSRTRRSVVAEKGTTWSSESESSLLNYASRHWTEHLAEASATPPEVQKELETFLETKLSLWIEHLELLGELMVAAAALETARVWYHEVTQPRHECVKAFADAQQLLLERSMMAGLVRP